MPEQGKPSACGVGQSSTAAAAGRLRGLWVPLVTPLRPDGRLDEPALERLVHHVIDGGADGLFLRGTTSEAASLGPQVGRRVIAAAVGWASALRPGGFPCVVCVSDPCLASSVEMARYAHRFQPAGVIAVAATSPYYYPSSDSELRSYFRVLSQASPLPVVLYNFPRMVKTALCPQLVVELARMPGIAGLKDSSGDPEYVAALLQRLDTNGQFSVLVGEERDLVVSLRRGAAGGVCGTANLVPGLFRDLIDAVVEGRDHVTVALEDRLRALHGIYRIGSRWSRHIANLKTAMALRGLCGPTVAPPLLECSTKQREAIARRLDGAGEWAAAPMAAATDPSRGPGMSHAVGD